MHRGVFKSSIVDNLGAYRLRRGHVGVMVACRADYLANL